MKNIIVAGATGYLGSFLIKELRKSEYTFKAMARNEQRLKDAGLSDDQIVKAEVTQPDTLKAIMVGADVIISTVGITRQKDGLSYMDVDYQANMNLLEEARQSGVKKFVYISVINGEMMKDIKIVAAKERFVEALRSSGLPYLVIRPNGFFSDVGDFIAMAKKGRVYLFGDGQFKFNPIHGADLGKFILDQLGEQNKELEVGGPDVLTQNEIAEMALKALDNPIKITHLPDWMRKAIISLSRTFTSSKTYGPIEFFLTMMGQDNIAPRQGIHRLHTYFATQADQLLDH
jgi:uncharacterized protein YbjT (DUF2867 family)